MREEEDGGDCEEHKWDLAGACFEERITVSERL